MRIGWWRIFVQCLSMSGKLDFPQLSEVNNSGVRVSVRKSLGHGQPSGIVVSAATSLWLPLPSHNVFNFFKDEKMRVQVTIHSHKNKVFVTNIFKKFNYHQLLKCINRPLWFRKWSKRPIFGQTLKVYVTISEPKRESMRMYKQIVEGGIDGFFSISNWLMYFMWQWDVLSNGSPVQEIVHISNGSHLGNCTSIIWVVYIYNKSFLILFAK